MKSMAAMPPRLMISAIASSVISNSSTDTNRPPCSGSKVTVTATLRNAGSCGPPTAQEARTRDRRRRRCCIDRRPDAFVGIVIDFGRRARLVMDEATDMVLAVALRHEEQQARALTQGRAGASSSTYPRSPT